MLHIGDFARLGNVTPRMLRHYDQIGLLRPDRVDAATGYRYYSVAQLGRLHRLLALRDLGFGLDQIRGVLDEEAPVGELRGMLRLRRAQIEAEVAGEQARLSRVEAHLRALERNGGMDARDIVIKHTQPVRVAEAMGTGPGFGHQNLGPLFERLLPEVLAHLAEAGVRPGISVAHYEWSGGDDRVVVHAGFAIGGQEVPSTSAVRVVDLPVVEVASMAHRGTMEGIEPAFEALIRWVEDSGYRPVGASRELYHEWNRADPGRHVTELQLPIAPMAPSAP